MGKITILFTDLDGTLLDYSTLSFEKALPALGVLREKGIPLIVSSSKTRKEIEHYRKKLGNDHPFVSENGGGIFIPKGYFGPAPPNAPGGQTGEGGFEVMSPGSSYADLRRVVLLLRDEGFAVRGFGDMTDEEIARLTHVSVDEARMAKEREFDEPFLFSGGDEDLGRLFSAIRAKGFNHTQGKFFHIVGDNDKGKAAAILIGLYRKKFGEVTTIAIGDGTNDLPMLALADYPVIVKCPDGRYDERIDVPGLIRADGVGPEGWNRAVLRLLRNS